MNSPKPPAALLAALAALALCAPPAWSQDEPASDEQAPAEAEAETETAPEPEPPAPPIGAVRRRQLKAAPETGGEEPEPREPAARPTAPRQGGGSAGAAQPTPAPPSSSGPLQPGTWDPGNQKPPKGLKCAAGKTPVLSRINLVIHNRPRPGKLVLDSTPITCDKEFCVKAGFANRNCCPLGAEGQQARVDCELLVLGVDPVDGIPGPHWMFQGNGDIEKHPQNPFLSFVFYPPGGGGTATVCNNIKPVVCNSIRVP